MISAGDIANLRIRNLVTQCLGGHGLHLADGRGRSISLRSQDLLVLCSDGLWSQLPEQQLLSQARHQGSLSRMTRDLAMAAQREKAPTSDNVSILVLRWLGQGPRFLKIGGRVAYRLEDIEAFEAAQIRTISGGTAEHRPAA